MSQIIDHVFEFSGDTEAVQGALDRMSELRAENDEAEANGVAGFEDGELKADGGSGSFCFWCDKHELSDGFVEAVEALPGVAVRHFQWTDDGEVAAWVNDLKDGEWRELGYWDADIDSEGMLALLAAESGDPGAATALEARIYETLDDVGMEQAHLLGARLAVYIAALTDLDGTNVILASLARPLILAEDELIEGLEDNGDDPGPLLKLIDRCGWLNLVQRAPEYQIQRETADGWIKAWGYAARTYPCASNDEDALAIFHRETARIKSVPHRLIRIHDPQPMVELALLGDGELRARREAKGLSDVAAKPSKSEARRGRI